MTIQSKLAPFIAAGMLLSSVAAHSQTAAAPDPNIAPSTVGEEAQLPATSANSPQLSTDRRSSVTAPFPGAARCVVAAQLSARSKFPLQPAHQRRA